MGRKETNIGNRILVDLARLGVSLFRNTRGFDRERKVYYGLGPNGASDYIGYTRVRITPDMVGKEVAIFTAIEIKADASLRPRKEQAQFISAVRNAGGIAGVAHDAESAREILHDIGAA